jgi:hypothetical protein
MAYEIVSKTPAAIGGANALGLLQDQNSRQSSLPRQPFKFPFDSNCPFTPAEHGSRQKYLSDRIHNAIILANITASKLEAKPLHPKTVRSFHVIFGQDPNDRWELPGMPTRKMGAGDIVAKRFRAVEKALQTWGTVYQCTPANLCRWGGRNPELEEPSHPTETIVRDPLAWAILCKNEVWLCPQFWQLRKEWQEATILHEMFHLCFGLTCAWFQHDGKERKRNNAYCYEALALSIVGKAPDPISLKACGKAPL